ncbi:dipeptide epimerase [Algivirga pacifica]|uniref:Dipeptide epimerase n=1 Tax=Algivirga pacifica TaxID=1162670 RepID=A0ABP9D6V2_9BACT
MEINVYAVDLPLRHTFKIAHDQRDVQQSVIVELTDGNFKGYGEATANPYYGVSRESIIEAVNSLKTPLADVEIASTDDFYNKISGLIGNKSFPLCALDEAAHDLLGKKKGMPTYKMWGLEAINMPMSNYTIGIDTVDKMLSKMQEVPWPLYKIKLGTSEDIEIIKTLRKHTDAIFRVDANCAWSVEETIENARVMKTLGVEFIEQPMKADNWEGMKEAMKHSALPLIADESCIVEEDVEKCIGHFHGINIKLTKCGGLTVARRMIEKARANQMKVMVGCMTESTVGISAIAQLLPLLDYVDMDGAMLLKEDPAIGVQLVNGHVQFATENGNGVNLKNS